LVWTVGVMKAELRGIDSAENTVRDKLAHRLHAVGESVGEIGREQAVGTACRLDDLAGCIGGGGYRLLAEDRDTRIQRGNCLVGMEGTRSCDHEAVEVARQEIVETGKQFCAGRD